MKKKNIAFHLKMSRWRYGEELTEVEKLFLKYLEEPWYKSILY
jgi:hypothetical protein